MFNNKNNNKAVGACLIGNFPENMASEETVPQLSTPRPHPSSPPVAAATHGIDGYPTNASGVETTSASHPQQVGLNNGMSIHENTRNVKVFDGEANSHTLNLFDNEIRPVKASLKTLSASVSKLERVLSSEIVANEKRKTIAKNSSFTVKKELTSLIRDEVSALATKHEEEIVRIRLENQKEMEMLRKAISSHSTLIQELQEEMSRMYLRLSLLDSSSPAFVLLANVSSISDKTFSDSATFYSQPCGHPMHLSVVKSPQGGLVVMLNIESDGMHEQLVTWPLLGTVIVEAIGFSALNDKDISEILIGTLELDQKSGKKGGGGYIGVLSESCARDKSAVLQCMAKQSSMWKKEKPTNARPYYYIKDNMLHFRVITRLHVH